MSNRQRLDLQRFDELPGPPPAVRLKAALTGELMSSPDPQDTSSCDSSSETEPDTEHAQTDIVTEPIGPDLADLETMLSALADAMYRLEDEARTRTDRTIRSLAAQLFPALSDLFLAEEIGRHLPQLIPSDAPAVEIRAEASLAEQLRRKLETSERLSQICSVKNDGDGTQGRVDIVWEQGGLSLNFEALLEACLARLESQPSAPER